MKRWQTIRHAQTQQTLQGQHTIQKRIIHQHRISLRNSPYFWNQREFRSRRADRRRNVVCRRDRRRHVRVLAGSFDRLLLSLQHRRFPRGFPRQRSRSRSRRRRIGGKLDEGEADAIGEKVFVQSGKTRTGFACSEQLVKTNQELAVGRSLRSNPSSPPTAATFGVE